VDLRKKEDTAGNSRFAKKAVSCVYESEVLNSNFVKGRSFLSPH
jgi:hypothetical protein